MFRRSFYSEDLPLIPSGADRSVSASEVFSVRKLGDPDPAAGIDLIRI